MTPELLAILAYLGTTGASAAINVKNSLDVKTKMESKNDIVIKKYNKLSTGKKILSNFWNVFNTLCPIYNIFHSVKHITDGKEWLYLEWKRDTLNSDIYSNVNVEEDKPEITQKVKKINPSINKFKVKPTIPSEYKQLNVKPTISNNKTIEFLYNLYGNEYNKYNVLLNSGTATREELNLQAKKVQIATDKYYDALYGRNNTSDVNSYYMSRRLK